MIQNHKYDILIVDDLSASRHMMLLMLGRYELQIQEASHGKEAIDFIKAGHCYKLILMDYMMPGLDGVETAKQIKELNQNVPIVALTGMEDSECSAFFSEELFTQVVSKPIKAAKLRELIHTYVSNQSQTQALEALSENDHRVNVQYAEILRRDIGQIICILEDHTNQDIQKLGIAVHGVKTLLRSIHKVELAQHAATLEKLCYEKNEAVFAAHLPSFASELKAVLQEYSKDQSTQNEKVLGDSKELLVQLQQLEEACESFDKKTAKSILQQLKEKAWRVEEEKLITELSALLLSGDYDEIMELISQYKKR